MVDLGAPAHGFLEGRRADGHDHELLNINVGIGVRSTVEDVHAGNREDVGVRAAQVLVESEPGRLGCGVSRGERNAEDGVGAKLALVVGAVKVEQKCVQRALIRSVHADDLGGQRLVDSRNSLLHALARIPRVVAIALLYGLECTGGRARRDGGTLVGAVIQNYFNFNRRVAARIKNLTGVYRLNECHRYSLRVGEP